MESGAGAPLSTLHALRLATVYQGDAELIGDFDNRILVSPDEFKGDADLVGRGRGVGHQAEDVAALVGQRLRQLRQAALLLGHI